MKIIIAGAGDIGFHLAELLVLENQNIILIDTDPSVLEYAAAHLDVLTIRGDSSSIDVLQQAEIYKAKLLLAVTTSEKNNLMTAILAKKLGAKQTIARVQSSAYLEEEQLEIFQELGIDNLISPQLLAAQEIERLVNRCTFTDISPFGEGKMSVVGITLDRTSIWNNKSLKDIEFDSLQKTILPVAILRGHRTIIPRGDTVLKRNDHIYFFAKEDHIADVERFVGKEHKEIQRIMILGGTGLAYETAKILETKYKLILIEKNKKRCKQLAEHLDNTLIVHGNGGNIDLLKEEGLGHMDVFIALTNNSETNIIASLTAKNHGVYKTIAQVENKEYVHISQEIGVDTLINQKLLAANDIFRFVRKGQVEAVKSLQGVDAEIIEFTIAKNNHITKKPLKDLRFPPSTIIGGVVRGEESIIPDGNFQLQLNDKAIVFARPETIAAVEKIFR